MVHSSLKPRPPLELLQNTNSLAFLFGRLLNYWLVLFHPSAVMITMSPAIAARTFKLHVT